MICCNANFVSQIKNAPKHVILIGFDVISANSVQNGVAMPTYCSMMKEAPLT